MNEYIVGEKGGKGGGKPREAQEADDNLNSKQTAKTLEVISEGIIESIDEVYFDDNPISNFTGAKFETRLGLPVQDAIPGFNEVTSATADNIEVTVDIPFERTVSQAGIDAVIVTYGVDALQQQDKTNGDINGYQVNLTFYIRASAGDTWLYYADDAIVGRTPDPYKRSIRIAAPQPVPNAWQWKVVRTTPTATTQAISDITRVFSHTEVQEVSLSYDNSALVGLFIPADVTGGRIPRRSYDVYGVKVAIPSNYNPTTRQYSGIWDGEAASEKQYTNNPAWVIYDLLTNTRYGMGLPDAQIDRYSFYDAAVYCDEMIDDGGGGTEPRYTFNSPIAKQQDSWKLLQGIAGTMHANLVDSSGIVKLFQDRPTAATDVITNNDVVDGLFTYRSTPATTRSNVIKVQFNEANNNFLKQVLSVESEADILTHGYRERDVVAYGCTSPAQAFRVGRWHLYTNLITSTIVEFSVGVNRINIEPYSIVNLQDEDYADVVRSGIIIASSSSSITLQTPITLGAGPYSASYYGQDGKTLNEVSITDANSTTATITGTFTDIPYVGSTMTVVGDSATRPFRITQISDNGDQTFNVVGVLYDEAKYAWVESDLDLPSNVYGGANLNSQEPVRNLVASVVQVNDGADFYRDLYIDWIEPVDNNATEYHGKVRHNDGNWSAVSVITATEYTINRAPIGKYEISVTAVNAAGVQSVPSNITYTIDSTQQSTLYPPVQFKVEGSTDDVTFNQKDLVVIWDEDERNVDQPDTLLEYALEVWNVADDTLLNTYPIPINPDAITSSTDDIHQRFVYTYAQNASDFGSPSRTVKFKLYAKDVNYRRSAVNALACNNPPPAAVTLDITTAYEEFWVKMAGANEPDIEGYKLWGSKSSSSFTPDNSNLIETSKSTSFRVAAKGGETWHFKGAAYDGFGESYEDGDFLFSDPQTVDGVGFPETYVPTETVYSGVVFKPSGNTISWTSGKAVKNDGDGTSSTWNIFAGSANWSSGILYLYNVSGSAYISSTTDLLLAVTGVILGSYRGGNDFTLGEGGGAYIDGSQILAQTIGANQIVTDGLIANSAAIKNGVIETAAIKDAAVTNAKIGGSIESYNYNATTKEGWQLDRNGTLRGQGISIYDTNGNLVFGSGQGLDYGSVTGTKPPTYLNASNISTYIQAASIDTLLVAGEAIIIPRVGIANDVVTIGPNQTTNVGAVAIVPKGAGVSITTVFSWRWTGYWNEYGERSPPNIDPIYAWLQRSDGKQITPSSSVVGRLTWKAYGGWIPHGEGTMTLVGFDSTPLTNGHYNLFVKCPPSVDRSNVSVQVFNRSMVLLGVHS